MSVAAIRAIPWLSGLSWLTGPLFDKELRVSSRRRRFYVVRTAYVCLLMMVVCFVWFAAVRVNKGASAVVQASRMSEAAKQIVTTVIWFQFITGQFLAAALLSGAINSEIRQRSLEVLLVTPISSLQIVVGKFLSKLLQLVSLLAIGLPPLAIVRVFGGVPWDFVISGWCITLTAALFVGALSLLLSVTGRQAHRVLVNVGGWSFILWGAVTVLLLAASRAGLVASATAQAVLYVTNPFVAMLAQTQRALAVTAAPGMAFAWPLHCVAMLIGAGVLLLLCLWRLRKAAITRIVARRTGRSGRAKARMSERAEAPSRNWPWRQTIQSVKGSPIAWKEMRRPWSAHPWRSRLYAGVFAALIMGVLFAFAFVGAQIYVVFYMLIQLLQLLFIVRLAISAASAVTREKEARTWPILLTTPLEDRQIVRGKLVGVFRRNLLLLAPLLLLYLLAGVTAPRGTVGLVSLAVSITGIVAGLSGAVFFLLGLGVYLSVRLKTTTAAVASTLGIYFGMKFFCCGGFSPLLLASAGAFRAAPGGGIVAFMPLLITIIPAGIYLGIGLLLARLATRRLRRDVFA